VQVEVHQIHRGVGGGKSIIKGDGNGDGEA